MKKSIVSRVAFCGNSLKVLKEFPLSVRREIGVQLDLLQRNMEPSDWKPMSSVGPGVREIRVRSEDGAFRVIYVTILAGTVHVLHCFQKKTQRTNDHDLNLARKRLRDLVKELPP